MRNLCIFITSLLLTASCMAGQSNVVKTKYSLQDAQAIYLGNEAILVEHKNRKVLFDPFFDQGFNTYQMVPDTIRDALFSGRPPYHNIDAIFISHAHADHFAATDLLKFLLAFPGTKVIAPTQAIDKIKALSNLASVRSGLHAIDLAYRDPPITMSLDGIDVDAVRIPHAGWPQRANVSNLVFRVSLAKELTVVHMGDADPNDEHFGPLMEHWNSSKPDVAFPPYWFLGSDSGQLILTQRVQADRNIGIHVPLKVPVGLVESGAMYLSQPGKVIQFSQQTNKK